MHQRKFEEALRQFHPRPTAVCCENLLAMLKAMPPRMPCLMRALEYQSTPISNAEHFFGKLEAQRQPMRHKRYEYTGSSPQNQP